MMLKLKSNTEPASKTDWLNWNQILPKLKLKQKLKLKPELYRNSSNLISQHTFAVDPLNTPQILLLLLQLRQPVTQFHNGPLNGINVLCTGGETWQVPEFCKTINKRSRHKW